MKLATDIQIAAVRNRLAEGMKRHRPRLLFCLRMTVAAAGSLGLAQIFGLQFHGLWAVLTAVVVMQVSVGGSLRAASDYIVGTLCGVAYATAIGLIFAHAGAIGLATALSLAVAPLAFAATVSPMFRVAPFTGVMVLLISSQFGEEPLQLALYRLLEVLLGGAVALTVSLWLFPERAHGLGVDAAARILEQLARDLRQVMQGFTQKIDELVIRDIQDATGRSVGEFQALIAEAERERLVGLVPQPHPGPLSRTLLRLRHDLVIIGRAAMEPLPEPLAQRLDAPLQRVASACSEYLVGAARALSSRASPPSLNRLETALDKYTCEVATLRREELTESLSSAELERLFALGFGFDQLHQHLRDLGRCADEWSSQASARANNDSKLRNLLDTALEAIRKRWALPSREKVVRRPAAATTAGDI
jgi:uncharacterized membrane protein YccC